MIAALLQHPPERHVRIVAMLGHVHGRHPERISLDLERTLTAEERFASERIDLRDLLVGHGVTAARGAVAVDHHVTAGAAVGAVERVGITDVDGKIIVGVRIELRRCDRVEALGRLAVALLDLGPQLPRPAADRVGL